MKAKYSKYFFSHLLFFFEPSVFTIPVALQICATGLELSIFWFNVVWYWDKQEN